MLDLKNIFIIIIIVIIHIILTQYIYISNLLLLLFDC
jgi:hypothetical protein